MRRVALALAAVAAVALAADLAVAEESSHRGGPASITLVQHRGPSGHHGPGPSSHHGGGPSSYHRGYGHAPSPHYSYRGPSVYVRPPAYYRYPAYPPVYRYPSCYYPYGYQPYYPYGGFQYYGSGFGLSIGF